MIKGLVGCGGRGVERARGGLSGSGGRGALGGLNENQGRGVGWMRVAGVRYKVEGKEVKGFGRCLRGWG